MTIYYAKSSGYFYDSRVHAEIPADSVEISAAERLALLSAGKQIVGDESSGAPMLASQSLEQRQADKIAEINAACQSAICLGFDSGALGATHAYPAKILDQQNLSASVLASLMPELPADWTTPFLCADAAGVWDFRAHTASQIQRAGQDGKAAILAAIAKNKMLADQVMAATTAEQVSAIAW